MNYYEWWERDYSRERQYWISMSKNIYPTTLFLILYFCMKLSMDLWHFYCWKSHLNIKNDLECCHENLSWAAK